MFTFSRRAEIIKPSATLTFNAYASSLKKAGRDIVLFTAGQPDYDPPRLLLEAAKHAIDHEKHSYTAVLGDKTLRERIASYLTKYNLTYKESEIAVSSGVKLALANTFLVLIDHGDEVIYPRIAWGTYIDMITLCGGKAVACELNEQFKMTPQEMRKTITPRTKAIIINSPSNPTGAVYTKHELIEIAKLAVEYNLSVVSDEIYSETVYGHGHISIASLEEEVPGIRDMTCTINGASKSLAIPGWRLGYTAAPENVIQKLDAIQGADASNAPSIVQFGLSEVLKDEHKVALEAYFEEKRQLLQSRRDMLVAGLQEIEYEGKPAFDVSIPEGAFYLWVNSAHLKNPRYGATSIDIRDRLLNEAGIAVTEGSAFGDDDYVRFSFATDQKDIEKGLQKLKTYLNTAVSV